MVKKSQRIWIIFVGLFIALVAAFAVPKTEDKEVHAVADVTISTVEDLEEFRNNINYGSTYYGQTIELAADLDLSGISNWTPIANNGDWEFRGTFNGNGHTISGMKINVSNPTGYTYVGLFGHVTSGATIQNLGLVNSSVTVSNASGSFTYTGGLVGHSSYSTITNCYVTGSVTTTGASRFQTGGLVGCNYYGNTISNCYATGSVTVTASGQEAYAGGLVGYQQDGNINNSYATNNITIGTNASNKYVGKLIGYQYASGTSSNLYYLSTSTLTINNTSGNCTNNTSSLSGATSKTAAQFSSGEVTCRLNNTSSTDPVSGGTPWYQSIDNDLSPHDSYPVLNSERGTVYYGYTCNNSTTSYSNKHRHATANHGHDFTDNNGFCIVCDMYQSCSGAGTSASPYQISNAGQLYWFASVINNRTEGGINNSVSKCEGSPSKNNKACGKLMDDIYLTRDTVTSSTASNWLPMGVTYGSSNTFAGGFDGNGHFVSGIKCASPNVYDSRRYIGFFGCANDGSSLPSISNLGIKNSYFYHSGGYNCFAGAIAGDIAKATCGGCYVDSDVVVTVDCSGTSQSVYVGGLFGHTSNNNYVIDSYSRATVAGYLPNSSGNPNVGGLIGYFAGGSDSVRHCYATGNVSATTKTGTVYVGKVIGDYNSNATIYNLYSLSSSTINKKGSIVSPSSDVKKEGTSKTAAQFASGEVTYLLNEGYSTGSFIAWYQSIDNELSPHDSFPLLDSSRGNVYKSSCIYYSNNPDATHIFDSNGFCTYCDAYQAPANGTGISSSPYQIGNAGQLYWFAAVVNDELGKCADAPASRNTAACATLMNDIIINEDISSESARLWVPVGKDNNSSNYYTGTFNGDGHTISGMKVNITDATSTIYAGLFGYANGATIQNVGIINSSVNASGSSYVNVGSLVGYQYSGAITNSYSTAEVNATSSGNEVYAGGFVGVSEQSSNISNCYCTGNVSATNTSSSTVLCGGFVGTLISSGTTEKCYSMSAVLAESKGCLRTGGFVGQVETACDVYDCYSQGNVQSNSPSATSGDNSAGGFVGLVWDRYSGTRRITRCYSSGTVSLQSNRQKNGGKFQGSGVTIDGTNNCIYCSNQSISYSGTGSNATNTAGTEKTAAQFASGEVTCLLNGEDGTTISSGGTTWYQSIDNGVGPDSYPLLVSERGTVYRGYKCNSSTLIYSNNELHTDPNNPNHDFTDNNGFCRICDAYQSCTGSGTAASPYQITNTGQLYWFAAVVNNDLDKCASPPAQRNTAAYGTLTDDIVINDDISSASARLWTPIGIDSNSVNYYKGTFEGNNHTISGMKVDITGATGNVYAGFFGYLNLSSSSTVQNLGIENIDINISNTNTNKYHYVGGLAGSGYANNVRGCHVTGNINIHDDHGTTGYYYYGGLFGCKDNTLNDCYVDANIVVDSTASSNSYAGGLIGYSNSEGINRCYSKGTISAKCCYTGGLVGYARQTTYINNCYSMVDVTSTYTANPTYTGGLVGYLAPNNADYVLSNSYSIGDVSASNSSKYVGRLVGRNYSGTVTNCYYLSTSALPSGGTICNEGTSKTSAQFASGEETYLLNQGQGIAWYQSLDNNLSPHDSYPLLDSARGMVYKGCNEGASTSSDVYYSNSPDATHTFDSNGFCQYCGAYQACEGGGTSFSDPYRIGNAGQLYWFAAVVNGDLDNCAGSPTQKKNAFAELTADITINEDISSASARLWTPIGTVKAGDPTSGSGQYPNAYKGGFDGKNHTISGMKINIVGGGDTIYAGFFGCAFVPSNQIRNVGLINSDVTVSGASHNAVYTGGLSGYCYGYITNSYSTCDVTVSGGSGTKYVGGLIGNKTTEAMVNNYATGAVTVTATGGTSYVGGFVGYQTNLTGFNKNYATGNVTFTSSSSVSAYVGGLVGYQGDSIKNSYATGAVNVTSKYTIYAGGIVGSQRDSSSKLENTYATGDVAASGSGTKYVGGLAGYKPATSNINNGYAVGNITVDDTGANHVGKIVGYTNSTTVTDAYYLASSTITNNGSGTMTDYTGTVGDTSKTATEFSNFAVKDLLQTYVDANTTASNQLSSWVQAQNSPEFNWDNHDLVTNISWGNMTFAYDPEEGTWALPEGDEGENVIVFTNESNGAKLRYNSVFDISSQLSGITGGIAHSSGDVTYQGATWPMVNSSDMTVSTNSRNTTLTISGTPSGGNFDRTTPSNPMEIGVVTMTISG